MTEQEVLALLQKQEKKFTKKVEGTMLYGYLYYAFNFLKMIQSYRGISPFIDERISLHQTVIYDMATYKVGTLGLGR